MLNHVFHISVNVVSLRTNMFYKIILYSKWTEVAWVLRTFDILKNIRGQTGFWHGAFEYLHKTVRLNLNLHNIKILVTFNADPILQPSSYGAVNVTMCRGSDLNLLPCAFIIINVWWQRSVAFYIHSSFWG